MVSIFTHVMSRDTHEPGFVPGAFFTLLVNLRRFISLPDLFPLAPANSPGSPRMGKHAVEVSRVALLFSYFKKSGV